jgi:hypothetical protein
MKKNHNNMFVMVFIGKLLAQFVDFTQIKLKIV